MKSIGILYICTGPYCLFWEDFYNTFEKNFLPGFEKKYFVFTDADYIYKEELPNVIRYETKPQPWPLITLLRFATFLSIEDEIKKCDYLMFSNANIVCEKTVDASEILPRESYGETLFVTAHPGYFKKNKAEYPYEHDKKSLAYIPWNLGNTYVIGAFFGGTSKAFIGLSKTLRKNIEEDLKRNVIAKWHDESHLNRYIVNRYDIRVLPPEYCYPVGMDVSYEKRITGVSKQVKFDVKSFKGIKETDNSTIFRRIILKLRYNYRWLLCIRDTLLRQNIPAIKDAE